MCEGIRNTKIFCARSQALNVDDPALASVQVDGSLVDAAEIPTGFRGEMHPHLDRSLGLLRGEARPHSRDDLHRVRSLVNSHHSPSRRQAIMAEPSPS